MKTRIKLKHFMTGDIIAPAYVVAVRVGGRWLPTGYEQENRPNGVAKYATREEAEVAAARWSTKGEQP